MSNKQEATWHGGVECPGTPHRGHTSEAPAPFNGICSGGTSAVYDLANDTVTHFDGSPCTHPEVAAPKSTRMAITEDPLFGASVPWQPQAQSEQDVSELGLDEWIGQALGAASSCWSDLPNAGVFDSTRCAAIAEALEAHISGLFKAFVKEAEERRRMSDAYLMRELKEAQSEPRLGLASTRALLQEIQTRLLVPTPDAMARELVMRAYTMLGEETLAYRTVGS